MTGILESFHAAVDGLVQQSATIPVYSYLPDDPAHLPCYVVNHPRADESPTKGVMTLELGVVLLGRRISDQDSQGELLAYADMLLTMLGGTRNVSFGERTYLRCLRITPAVTSVAGLDYPTYLATVQADALSPTN